MAEVAYADLKFSGAVRSADEGLRCRSALVLGQKPRLGLFRCFEQECFPAPSRALQLQAGKRSRDHERDTLRRGGWRSQNLLEFGDGVLRLNLHLAHVDEGEVLVGSTTKLAVSQVPCSDEASNVACREEAAQLHSHQVQRSVDSNRKRSWLHNGLVPARRFRIGLRRRPPPVQRR